MKCVVTPFVQPVNSVILFGLDSFGVQYFGSPHFFQVLVEIINPK